MKRYWSLTKSGMALGRLYQWLRFWVNRTLGNYSPRQVHVDGDLNSLGPNICILSIYSNTDKLPRSTLCLVRAIKREGYDMMFVVNGRKVEANWLEGEVGERDIFITRPNLGRDFAAYQLATNLLLEAEISLERLLYCNDSVFFLDKNDPKKVFRLLVSSADNWIGMTENYPVYHVSSWCFQLSSEIVGSPAFAAFWQTYRPVDSHSYAVRAGEERLTSVLLKAGYTPRILFDTASLLKAVLQAHKITDKKSVWHQLQSMTCGTASSSELAANLTVLFQGERANQANNLAILLISELGFPFIKKKLLRQTNFPRSLFIFILEEFMTGFCPAIVHEIRLADARLRS